MDNTEAGTTATADGRPDPTAVADAADRILLSYRVPEASLHGDDGWELADSGWIREGMNAPSYLRYLRYAHAGTLSVGDEFEEFVNCGCASPMDVVIRVERIEGGSAMGADTALDVVPRRDVVEGEMPA
jgi:hypothetical protein